MQVGAHRLQGSLKPEVGSAKFIFSPRLPLPSCKGGSPPPRCSMQDTQVCTEWTLSGGGSMCYLGHGPLRHPLLPFIYVLNILRGLNLLSVPMILLGNSLKKAALAFT